MYVKPGVHDVAYLTLLFPNSVMADLRVSWLDPCKLRRITIVGSKKMIVYDDLQPDDKLLVYDKGVDIQRYTDTYEDFHLAYRCGDIYSYPIPEQEPLKMECEHFLECIRARSTPRSDGMFGLKVVKVLETAQKSLLNGGVREALQWESREIFSASHQT
jgi:predicted dehydrogenase